MIDSALERPAELSQRALCAVYGFKHNFKSSSFHLYRRQPMSPSRPVIFRVQSAQNVQAASRTATRVRMRLPLLRFQRLMFRDRIGNRFYRRHKEPGLIGRPAGAGQKASLVVAVCPGSEGECGAFGGRFFVREDAARLLADPTQEPPL